MAQRNGKNSTFSQSKKTKRTPRRQEISLGGCISLAQRGRKVREAILAAALPADLLQEIVEAYGKLCQQYGSETDTAVRSSATDEDLPNDGVGLAREEFIISSAIQVHPLALFHFDALPEGPVKEKIAQLPRFGDRRPSLR
jgi:phosphoenolpyruvate synthase/pyruvate phosphate dikinase